MYDTVGLVLTDATVNRLTRTAFGSKNTITNYERQKLNECIAFRGCHHFRIINTIAAGDL